jgi:predicted ATPase with chaperone activity
MPYEDWGNPSVLQASRRWSKPNTGGDIVLCMSQLNLSARAYHRTRSVKLVRTIADLAGCDEIQSVHLEALQYSPKLMHSTMY